VFVDANDAGNVVTRRSHTGVLLFIQNSPIVWLSRRHNKVETSTFGGEFVAMRTPRDMIIAMRYKLRMFVVPLDRPAQVYCDNQGVVKNTSISESTLSKKHNAIMLFVRWRRQKFYKCIRWTPRQIWRTYLPKFYIPSDERS
jgi:hypothetical protein